MAQNFNEMTKEELEAVLNSDSIVKMNAAELNNLRKAVKAAGLLSVQYDNMLGIAINNRTYEEIKNSDKYTEEEKALALDARNEYNKELRARTKNKLYNAEEIMSKAVESNGKYHFDELTQGEMDFLLANGIVRLNQLNIGKPYNIGQVEKVDAAKGSAENLSEDVKKAANFWNKFNDNKSGVQYIIQALKDNSVKVEAQKNKKTIFTGIDRGNKGFDVVKDENKNQNEPYAIYDLIIKKAKTSNPKAKIRIKDNVKDPVLRNKILIACAKNNMEPMGNLPQGFDFAALKELVKDVKDLAAINALAENLYENSVVEIVNEKPEKENKIVVAAVVNTDQAQKPAENKAQTEKKENKTAVAGAALVNTNQAQKPAEGKSQDEKKDDKKKIAVVPLNGLGGNGNNGAVPSATPTNTNSKPVETPKRPWWKKVRDAVVVGGIALLGLIGVRSCQNQERLEKKVKDLQEQVDNKSIEDCETLGQIRADAYMRGFADATKDCEEQNKPKPKPVVKKKTPVRKQTTVKKQPVVVKVEAKKEEKQMPDLAAPVYPAEEINALQTRSATPDTLAFQDVPVVAPKTSLEPIDTGIKHEKDYELNEAVELNAKGEVTPDNAKKPQGKGKTLDLSNPVDFNKIRQSINTNVH